MMSFYASQKQKKARDVRVPALNKPRPAMMSMMAMITMTMEMITKTEIKDDSAQRRQPCCGGGGGEKDGCSYASSFGQTNDVT